MARPTLNLRAPNRGPGFGIFAEGSNPSTGSGGTLFFREYVLHPATEDRAAEWGAPLDLRGYINLGDDPGARISTANRNAVADSLGLSRASLPDSNLADILAHYILGTLADPTGASRVKPLRFGRRGLELFLNNHLVLQEPLHTNHPNFQATLDVRWADYRRHKATGTPVEVLQRWTGACALKYFGRQATSTDLDRLLPPEHRSDGSRRPRTTVTEDFSGDLTAWTQEAIPKIG